MTKIRLMSIVCGMLAIAGVYAINAYSHCQVPCGIYGDEMKFDELRQDAETVTKAMNLLIEISESDESVQNYNQFVRWVDNKESHAENIMNEMEDYFLSQRVKPADKSDEEAYEKYVSQLIAVHHVIMNAMKCKQTVDLQNAANLSKSIEDLYVAYFGKEHEKHTH